MNHYCIRDRLVLLLSFATFLALFGFECSVYCAPFDMSRYSHHFASSLLICLADRSSRGFSDETIGDGQGVTRFDMA